MDSLRELIDIATGGETLATWNRHRGHLGMDGRRHPGGEWDTLRAVPIRTRRALTAAGYLARGGMQPDDFADLLRRNLPAQVEPDPIAWYIATARRILRATPYETRTRFVRERGYASLWYYRKARGWVPERHETPQVKGVT
jgi:hypothetical protein